MTQDKDFKQVVRQRAAKTGESYAAARASLTSDHTAPLTVVRDELAASVHLYWSGFRPELRGLTDDEYRWEPAPGCPTIHQRPDGSWTVDHQFPVVGAASIAQRLCWAGQLLRGRANQHFGDRSLTPAGVAVVPGDAQGGVAYLDGAVRLWHDGLAQCPPDALLQHSDNAWPGAIDGQFPLFTTCVFMFQLLVVCCSQVSTTRDVYLRWHPDIVGPR